MTKGRKTTFEERIQIVNHCLKHQKNYQVTSEIYEVSYQQVYQWVQKFEVAGEEGLRGRRGRTKEEIELTTEEKLQVEIKRIARENERLRGGNRKEASLSQIRLQQRYLAIQELHEEAQLAIISLCEIAGVSRAAYYKWLDRTAPARELENEQLWAGIQPPINEKRIYRIMHTHDLQSVIRRKRKGYRKTKADHVAEKLLNRELKADKPNQKWCTDVTEFKYNVAKKTYLSAIIDLYDGSIISYRLGHSNNNPLVFDTIRPAIEALSCGARPLIHSDCGNQYTSKEFKRLTDKAKITHSMSRPDRCLDNAPIEGFWGSLKCKMYYLSKFDTFEELEKAIATYIFFYNTSRYQKRLSGLSPLEYRAQAA